jgi:hypothetical protein
VHKKVTKRIQKREEFYLLHNPSLVFEAGSPYWKHSELFFEKKAFIPTLQQLLIQTENA